MTKVGALAEEQNHHPKWTNEYNKVEIWLSTHEAKGHVTAKDQTLAADIDKLYKAKDTDTIETKDTETLTEVKLFTDGGSRGNPGPSASGYVLLDMADKVLLEDGAYLGITTNNQAEYKALKLGLETALKRGVETIHIYMDSLLIVNQMKGTYKIKNRDLLPIYQEVQTSLKQFKTVDFTHVPRELNKLADAMVNEILDSASA